VTPPGMFGDDDQPVQDLFPPSVRPAFLRLLWISLAVLAVAAGLLIAAAIGMAS
jgi:hypothetical protein